VTQDAKPSLPDRTGFWLAVAAVVAGLGGAGITIAVTEYHPPWTSVWFIVGAAACALGCVSVLWSLVLYLARKVAEDRYQADRQRFMSENFSVQREALINVKDLISSISEEFWNLRNEQQVSVAPGQLELFAEIIEKMKKEDRFASEEDLQGFLEYSEAEKESAQAWLEKAKNFC
jgi:hypothetical protein